MPSSSLFETLALFKESTFIMGGLLEVGTVAKESAEYLANAGNYSFWEDIAAQRDTILRETRLRQEAADAATEEPEPEPSTRT